MAQQKIRVQNVKTGQIKMMTAAAIKALKGIKMFGDFDILPDPAPVVTGKKPPVKKVEEKPMFTPDGEMIPGVEVPAALKIDFEPTK